MKKFLLSLIATVMSLFSAHAAWEQTTSIAVGDVVVLAVDNGSVTRELSGITTTGTTIGQVEDYTTTPAGVYPLTVVKGSENGSFGFKNADGAYLAWSSGNSLKTISELDASSSWTVSFTEAGTADIYNVGTPERKLQYNASSPRFACYGNSGQTAPIFFKQAAAGTVLKPTITPGSTTVFEAQEVTITAEDGVDIYYTLNGGEEQKYEAAFTVTETTTIEAYAKKGEEKSETAKVVITFGPVYNTFAAANEAATSTRVVSRLNFTDALVTYVNGSNAYIQDASGAMMIYGTNELVAGDKIKGYIQGQLYLYNGLPEIASPTFEVETVSSGNTVKPTEVDAADLAANPLKYVSQYVTVKPAKFEEDAEVATKVNLNFTVGETALVLRNNFVLEFGVEAGKSYEVAALVTIYNSTIQLYPTKEEDIAEMGGDEAAYYDALASIEAGAVYRIKTNVGGTMYYLKSDGTLTADAASAGAYKFSKIAGAAYEYGFNLLESYFTNPPQGGNPVLANGRIAVDPTSKRADWEAQVFFLKDGKYAVRATNAAGGDSGWPLNARTFWTVNEGPVAEYSFDMNYIWELEYAYDAEAAKQHEEAAALVQTWVTTIQAAKGLVQDASMYTSNAVQQGEGSIAALLDGTYESYFHSCWSNGPAEDHYLQAELPEATQKFQFYYKKRHNNNNNRPTSIVISASNDGASFTDVMTINSGLPTDASVLDYVSDVIDLGSAYKYVRFTITGTNNGATNNGHLFFTFSEFYMLPNVPEAEEALAVVKENIPTYSLDVDKVMAIDEALKAAFRTVNVTYALYEADGTTLVSQKIIVQEAGSEVNVPSDLAGVPYYDYATEGTIGNEDCTIKIVRSFKEGVVHSLSDLNNNKAYTISCDRGALLTKDGYVASTAHSSLTNAEPGLFAIINHEDHYYLYSVADKKFMTFDPSVSDDGSRGPLADEPTHGTEDAIILEAKTDPYFFAYFTAGGSNYGFNTNGNNPYGYVINSWMNADPGNQYYIIEAADFDPKEALIALGVQPTLEYAKYIVQNVGSGLYWGAGNDWGTRASLIPNPEFVKFDPTDMPEGQYKLESQVNNGGTQYYFNGDYMDNGSPVALAITMLANGNYTIANAADGGFYGYDGNSTILG
ncbi:MAG: discoidin domain-containing protein, partial [Bacteroidaceae bacterium]|nr:discoidin domain-containing protein [Bacteroidaceae bacterium]